MITIFTFTYLYSHYIYGNYIYDMQINITIYNMNYSSFREVLGIDSTVRFITGA